MRAQSAFVQRPRFLSVGSWGDSVVYLFLPVLSLQKPPAVPTPPPQTTTHWSSSDTTHGGDRKAGEGYVWEHCF